MGYTRFDEHKVMGLAPYGDPERYAELFARTYRPLPGGDCALVGGAPLERLMASVGLARHACRKGEPFTRAHRDFSAALRRIILHVLTHFQAETGARSLCLAGGVAHNCSLNGRIAYSGLFDRVWVQPAAHDAGNALGAALSVLHDQGVPMASKERPGVSVLLNTSFNNHAEPIVDSGGDGGRGGPAPGRSPGGRRPAGISEPRLRAPPRARAGDGRSTAFFPLTEIRQCT